MAEQLPDTYYRTPFKFNGKELDEETGLYYYGARYYDPKISIWLSVDPLAEAFPNWNPYNYTMQNPINFVDPDGRAPLWIFIFDSKGNMTVINDGNSNITIQTSKGSFSPSKVDNSRGSLKALAKITAHFAGQKGFGGRKVKLSTKDMGTTGGFYNPKDDSMTLLFSAFKSGIFDNANNLNSTLNHEIGKLGHRGEDHSIAATYLSHANVYLNEATQSEFSGTSDSYKYSTAFGFARRVFNAHLNGEFGHNEEENIIKSFNDSNAHQIYIDYKSWNGSGSAEIFIKGKSFGERELEPIDKPQH